MRIDPLSAYAGKAVAIVDGEVRASGTWDQVAEAAERLGIRETATFTYVPVVSLPSVLTDKRSP